MQLSRIYGILKERHSSTWEKNKKEVHWGHPHSFLSSLSAKDQTTEITYLGRTSTTGWPHTLLQVKNGLIHGTISSFLINSNYSRTRGQSQKLKTNKFRCETSKHFFCNRFVKPWNSLTADILNSSTVTRFDSTTRELNLNQDLRHKELWWKLLSLWQIYF